MDALSRAQPRPRSAAAAAASPLPWARFSAWLECVCVVTFDLELGQAMEVPWGRPREKGGGRTGSRFWGRFAPERGSRLGRAPGELRRGPGVLGPRCGCRPRVPLCKGGRAGGGQEFILHNTHPLLPMAEKKTKIPGKNKNTWCRPNSRALRAFLGGQS